MLDFHAIKETTINASPEAVFDVVSDLSRHRELAGSGELVNIRLLTPGPVGLGTMVEADESIHLGDQHMEFAARSVVVAFDRPNTISWVPAPPVPVRRIQWWFHLTPDGQGTKVVHEAEVDLGEGGREMFGGTENYNQTRGADVIRGMEKTLQNLQQMVEQRVTAR
ncbi:MAG: SRPBCC family protein [Dehalococcoidia bacterium]|jgi:uncharacterized protein YndB with AHSA1/START domain|nr:SRPBCC family protein [Dehalococcoidia bacterium]MDP6226547.1 SRPBCC family protein [Dehalococcoidia bacterium]MDP7084670.1 SRPBCC family protein [Dehalococcoidia bacterium]MDP7200846.1 SRPBCC family protein [Dehalococcoidia bacterium]MDP7510753.1 SRPBCC family protein [Dehalococcoidia bacterium]